MGEPFALGLVTQPIRRNKSYKRDCKLNRDAVLLGANLSPFDQPSVQQALSPARTGKLVSPVWDKKVTRLGGFYTNRPNAAGEEKKGGGRSTAPSVPAVICEAAGMRSTCALAAICSKM